MNGIKTKRTVGVDFLFFLLIAAFGVFTFINTRQDCVHLTNSDAFIHSVWASELFSSSGVTQTYPIWHLTVFLLNKLTGSLPSSAALANAFFVICRFIVIRYCFLYCFRDIVHRKLRFAADAAAGVCLVFTCVFIPIIRQYGVNRYLSAQWHNPTDISVTPIAFIILFLYLHIYRSCSERGFAKPARVGRAWLLLSALILLSVCAKPSFFQLFVAGTGLLLLADLIFTRGRSIGFLLCTALACVPAAILFISQFLLVFIYPEQQGSQSGISISFFGEITALRLAVDLLHLAFPISVLVLGLGGFYNKLLVKYTSALLVGGSVIYYCFAETGSRVTHGNFSWARHIGIYFIWFAALNEYIHLLLGKSEQEDFFYYFKVSVSGLLLVLHIIGGLYYMYRLISDPATWLL